MADVIATMKVPEPFPMTEPPHSLKYFLKIHHSQHRAEDRDLGGFGRKHGSVQTGKKQLHND